MADHDERERALSALLSDDEWRSEEVAARFSGAVVARIKRRRRLRAVVLTAASVAGLVISGAGLEEIVRLTPALRAGLEAALGVGALYSICMTSALAALALELAWKPARA